MLGEALRLMRIFNDLKVVEIAEKLQISAGHISDIEHGKKTPSLELINKYANVFGTTPSAILFFSEELGENKNSKVKIKETFKTGLIKLLKSIERFDNEHK